MFAARFQIREHGDAFADAREIVNGEFHFRGVRDGEQMQHGVGGTAQRDDHGDGVLEGFFGEDIQRTDALAQHVHDARAGATAVVELGGGNGVLRGTVGQAHAERFDGAGHGVGGVHAAAGAGAGNGALFDLLKFLIGNFVVRVRADGFEHRDDVELARVAGDAAGQNGAAVDEHGRAIHARDGDERAGHVFIATADGHITVHARATDDGFDGISDDFAGHERIFHAFAAHRDAVGNGDGVENDGFAAVFIRAFLGFQRELVDVHVARGDVAPGGGDADDGLGKIFRLETDRIQHGAGGGAFGAVDEDAGIRAERITFCVLRFACLGGLGCSCFHR